MRKKDEELSVAISISFCIYCLVHSPLNPTRLIDLDGRKEEKKGIEEGKGKNSLELSFHIVKGTEPLCLAAAMVDRVAKVEVAVR